MPDPILSQKLVGPLANFTYLLGDPATKKAVVVDPSFGARTIARVADEAGLAIELILATHHHQDHVAELPQLKKMTGARVAIHESSHVPHDIGLKDGDTVKAGGLAVRAFHTPGHTRDSMCFQFRDKLWTGDTLFVGSFGRCDLEDSSPGDLYESLQKLARMDRNLTVYPGHHYGLTPTSTIAYELLTNMVYKVKSREHFLMLVGGDVDVEFG